MSYKITAAAGIVLMLSGCAAIDEFLFDAYPDGTPIRGEQSSAPSTHGTASQTPSDNAEPTAIDAEVARKEAESAAIERQKQEEAELLRVQQAAQEAEEARIKAEEAAKKARGELWYRIGFRSGRTHVDKATARALKKIVEKFKQEPPEKRLAVRGYCDAEPIGGYNGKRHSAHNFDSQIALSQARADSVAHKLVEYGIPPELVTAEGYGASEFIADNNTAEGRDQNRRVDIFLVDR